MSLFHSILEQLSKSVQGKQTHKDVIVKEIGDITGITISIDHIYIKNQKIFFSVSPTIKTALFLQKEALLQALKKYNIHFIG